MKKLHAALCMVALLMVSLNMVSCLDAVEQEYRVTVPTFATVTHSEDGKVRLYLDENRGILNVSEKSADINWGNAVRTWVYYDLPIVGVGSEEINMESVIFNGIVRSATKIDTVSLVDVTGMEELPSTLGNDTLHGFKIQAYRGYLTLQTWVTNNQNFYMTCSYDREKFDGENLYMNLHYKKMEGTWHTDILQTVCAPLPAFLLEPNVVKADSLNIIVSAPVWSEVKKDSAYVDNARTKISSNRLNQPTYY